MEYLRSDWTRYVVVRDRPRLQLEDAFLQLLYLPLIVGHYLADFLLDGIGW